MSTKIITGIPASPGIRIGKAYLYRGMKVIIPKYSLKDDEVQDEIARFEKALITTKEQIRAIQQQIALSLSSDEADIFVSHLMMLEDPVIVKKAMDSIKSEKRNIEWILNDLALALIKNLGSIDDDYMRERIIDISDINKRLISNLQKTDHESLADLNEEVIVFADELTPSDTASMNRSHVLAFVTNSGGKTSHTAILARALEIPAVVGTHTATSVIKHGDTVIVDANNGKVIIYPDEKEIEHYIARQQDILVLERELSKLTRLPSITIDERMINIYGNIELPEEMDLIREHGAVGIGLFRSEFLFMDTHLPDEEKQLAEYQKVVDYFRPLPVTIRTIDVGGDKVFGLTKDYKERNPFLGCRAIRFSLNNIDLFKTQIRAILRASAFGNVKIMFPMISTVEEMIKARDIVHDCMTDLRNAGKEFNENIQIGAMIEVPSAVINIDVLSTYSDFFSVGTNDLIQYTLAVDRIGEKVAHLYNPVDLSILRLLKKLVSSCEESNKPLSICGEMAGEPLYTMILLGLGFRELSMAYTYMYQVKRVIRSVTMTECIGITDRLMHITKPTDAQAFLKNFFNNKFQSMAYTE